MKTEAQTRLYIGGAILLACVFFIIKIPYLSLPYFRNIRVQDASISLSNAVRVQKASANYLETNNYSEIKCGFHI